MYAKLHGLLRSKRNLLRSKRDLLRRKRDLLRSKRDLKATREWPHVQGLKLRFEALSQT
jgi:hypothetical protein